MNKLRTLTLAWTASTLLVSGTVHANCGQSQMEIAEERLSRYELDAPLNLMSACGIGSILQSDFFDLGGLSDSFTNFLENGACGVVEDIAGAAGIPINPSSSGTTSNVEDLLMTMDAARAATYQRFEGREQNQELNSGEAEGATEWEDLYNLYR